jgi:hypothetical protein
MPTLFVRADASIHLFRITHQVDVSEAFINCADAQLTPLFERQTGLKAGNNVCFAITSGTGGLHYKKGKESQISIEIYINLHWNPIIIKWKSKSGRIYDLTDTDIDCNDIEFSFGKLDAALYHRQLYPGGTLPFKLKDLSYELQIDRLNVDAEISLLLNQPVDTDALFREIEDLWQAYNIASEKKERKYGLVHNAKYRAIDDTTILLEFDLGSAGMLFLKKLLEFLSSKNVFERVVIG